MTPVEEIIDRRNKYRTGNGGAPYWLDIEVLLTEREQMFQAIARLERKLKAPKCTCRYPSIWGKWCLECDRERENA